MASSDSEGDWWVETLRESAARAEAGPSNRADVEASGFLCELLRGPVPQRPEDTVASAGSVASAAAGLATLLSEPRPAFAIQTAVVVEASCGAPAAVAAPPGKPARAVVDAAASDFPAKRRRSAVNEALRPPTALETRSWQHQHAEMCILMAAEPAITSALCRCFFQMRPVDLTTSSLDVLANSLADRVLGILATLRIPIFKVGLTRSPRWRFRDAPFAYAGDYDRMEVLAVGFTGLIQWLEAALITRLQGTQGCQNCAPGGESPPPRSFPCYLYVVTRPVEDRVQEELRAARSRRLSRV